MRIETRVRSSKRVEYVELIGRLYCDDAGKC